MKLTNLFIRKKSSQIAKERLKILLISDRVNCSPQMLELMKLDIVKVISKYIKIDAENMEIQITKHPSIYASVPIVDFNKPQHKGL